MQVLHATPRLQDLWQMHFSQLSGQEYTVPGLFIANQIDEQPSAMPIAAAEPPSAGATAPAPPIHHGAAFWFKVTARTALTSPSVSSPPLRNLTVDPPLGM